MLALHFSKILATDDDNKGLNCFHPAFHGKHALVVVGDRHGQCSAPMSYEFWHVQSVQNESTQPVFNPNEGHGFGNPADPREVMERAVEWFAHYMPSGE